MSEVLSIRIPRELKKRMEALRGIVDWKREIIEFLEQRVRHYEKIAALEEVRAMLEKHPVLPRGTAEAMVREDRDSS